VRSTGIAYLCWLLFGSHYLYLGRFGTQILFWISLFLVVGWLWWIIDLFRIPGLVARANLEMLALGRGANINANANVSTQTVNINIDRNMLRQMMAEEKATGDPNAPALPGAVKG
jgi:TM2 domain-containing membrane protein YozV